MTNLIDRMITRIQRPVSLVEPLLIQSYATHPSPNLDGAIDPTTPIESRAEASPHPTSSQSTAGLPQHQQAEDMPAFRTTAVQQLAKNPSTDSVRREHFSYLASPALTPDPPLSAKQPSPSTQRLERNEIGTPSQLATQTTAHHLMHEMSGKDLTESISSRSPKLFPRNEIERPGERRAHSNSPTQNQLGSASTTEVNILIDHIEVRAIQRSEPIRKPISPPHITLDDYLHRRSGAQQ